jgi:hypothetical protein
MPEKRKWEDEGFGIFIPMATLDGALLMRKVWHRMTDGMVGQRQFVEIVENTDVLVLTGYEE